MASKNAFLKKLQAEQERKSKAVGDLTERWTMQAALDAALITLAYGSCMGNDQWGAKRLEAFGDELVQNILWVVSGARYEPGADGVRAEVDKLLKKKIPHRFGPWGMRYVHWIEPTLEEEAAKNRSQWKKAGMDTEDRVTSALLKGVGQ